LKRKPDQVHVFRLELQQKERELLDTYTTAYAVKSWSEPVVDILKDVTATLTILGILGLILGDKLNKILPSDWLEITSGMSREEIMDYLEIQNLVGAGIGGVFGLVLGGWLGAFMGVPGIIAGAGAGGIAGAAAGSYTVEQLEDLNEERKEFERLSKIAVAITLSHAIRRAEETLRDPAGSLYSTITGR